MLDLAYVRENLTQVEEMLRRRGMDPAQVLSGFRQVDEKRRQLITQSERPEGAAESRVRRDRQAEKIRAGRHRADGADESLARAK